MQTNRGESLCMCATQRDFTMMHNACISVCALIHLLSWLPGLSYTGLVRIIKSDSFLFYFIQVFQACSDLFTCTAVSQRYWFSVSPKHVFPFITTCIAFQLPCEDSRWCGCGLFGLRWEDSPFPWIGPYSHGGVRGQTPSPVVTCLLLRATLPLRSFSLPKGAHNNPDKDSFFFNRRVLMASLRISKTFIINNN